MAKKRGTRIDSIAAMDMETFKPLYGFGRQHFGTIAKAMGVRFPSNFSTTFIGPLPANANETVVCTTPPLNISQDFATVFLMWFFNLVAGTSTTAVAFRLRRGTTVAGVGVGLGLWQNPLAAGVQGFFAGFYADTPGAVAGQQYSLTISQVGATAAGTFGDVAMLAFSL